MGWDIVGRKDRDGRSSGHKSSSGESRITAVASSFFFFFYEANLFIRVHIYIYKFNDTLTFLCLLRAFCAPRERPW